MAPGTQQRSTGDIPNYQSTTTQGPTQGTRSNDGLEVKAQPFWRALVSSNFGLLLVIASEMFFSFMHLAVKILNSIDPPVSMAELILVRMAITYVCSIVYMYATGVPNIFLGPKGIRWLLFFRGAGGYVGLYSIYFSLQYLSLSDAIVLTFLAPMCTAVAGAVLLGEQFTVKQALAGLSSLLGVILIARPPLLFGAPMDFTSPQGVTPAQRLLAVSVSLTGVIGITLAFTTLRAIGKRAHAMHSMASFAGQAIVYSALSMLVTRTEFVVPTKISWLSMLLMIGIFGFVAQMLLTVGLQYETAGRGTMGVYTQIVFATILQKIFLHTTPPFLSILGTVIIISAALYTALSKVKQKEQAVPPPQMRADEEQGLLGGQPRRDD